MTVRFGSTLEAGSGSRPDPARTRRAILDAARQRFLHYGYKKTTVDEITTDAGVAKGTMYLYFTNKEAILFTLVQEIKREITQRLRQIAAGASTPPEKLSDMLAARVVAVYEACTGTPHGCELIEEIRPQLVECGREEHDAQIALLADVLREGHRLGIFDVADPARAAHLLVAACAAFMPPYLCPAFPTPRTSAELEAGAREMFAFLLRGLRRCR
jgi:AcrR family transcriptional regulator